jgi:hypothetical protein
VHISQVYIKQFQFILDNEETAVSIREAKSLRCICTSHLKEMQAYVDTKTTVQGREVYNRDGAKSLN